MAQVQNGTTAAADSVVNQLGRPCRRLWIRCDSTSPEAVTVRIQNDKANDHIHDDGDERTLAVGEEQVYDASGENKIANVRVRSAGGTGTFSMESTAT